MLLAASPFAPNIFSNFVLLGSTFCCYRCQQCFLFPFLIPVNSRWPNKLQYAWTVLRTLIVRYHFGKVRPLRIKWNTFCFVSHAWYTVRELIRLRTMEWPIKRIHFFFVGFLLDCCTLRIGCVALSAMTSARAYYVHYKNYASNTRSDGGGALTWHTYKWYSTHIDWIFVHYIFNSDGNALALVFILRVRLLFFHSLASFFSILYHEFITRTFTMLMNVTLEMGINRKNIYTFMYNNKENRDEKRKKYEHVLTKWMGTLGWHIHVPPKIRNRRNKLAFPVIYAGHVCVCVCWLLLPLCVWYISMNCIHSLLSLQTKAILFFGSSPSNSTLARLCTHFTHTLHDFAVNYVHIFSLE